MNPGDVLILYGRSDVLRELDERRKGVEGEASHQAAVSKQREEVARQEQEEQEAQLKSESEQREKAASGRVGQAASGRRAGQEEDDD
jgi:hypothetical protein